MKKISAIFLVGLMLIISACSSPQKSKKYNEAIEAYNGYLDEVAASGGIGDTQFRANYAFFDVNDDGIPELHTKWLFYDIYSYKDGQVVKWYEGKVNGMNGPTDVLENGAVFSRHDSTGTFYEYTTFDKDGNAKTVAFDCLEGYGYNFNGKAVTKEQWQQLTKEYLELSKKTAKMEWKSSDSISK